MTAAIFHSRPGARFTLCLEMNGITIPRWGNYYNIVVPPFDNAGDTPTVQSIWQQNADVYAPFDIDVTTESLPPQKGLVGVVAIGGSSSDWYTGQASGGLTEIDSFFNVPGPQFPGVSFVFSRDLGNNTQYVARGAMHEAGHGFGLHHQSIWVNGVRTEEYDPGTAEVVPIMGLDFYATRAIWTVGHPDYSDTLIQDDVRDISYVVPLIGPTMPTNDQKAAKLDAILADLTAFYAGGGGGGGGASPDGTQIPPAATITDAASGVWSMSGSVILLNGAQAAGGTGSTILWKGGVIYVQSGSWFKWLNSNWQPTSSPL